jgi:ribonuclease P protein component
MINKTHRFHGYHALTTVYRKGATVRSSTLALKYLANPRRDSYRLAVVVSRKVHKSAVVRNRIRRRVYETFREYEHLFGPTDMVVTVFAESVATLPPAKLHDMIARQLEQARLIPADAARPDML